MVIEQKHVFFTSSFLLLTIWEINVVGVFGLKECFWFWIFWARNQVIRYSCSSFSRLRHLVRRDADSSRSSLYLYPRSNVIVIYCQNSLIVIVHTACTISVYSWVSSELSYLKFISTWNDASLQYPKSVLIFND